ncbi:S-formylglutathione hydrolase [Thalassobium sp. R2A62]|jgi:S-formylglutathione hydrolase|uniref:S-formylglutathione hydrolase n=1 Tax=Thalassobium sp. R2A62 TaxID=633131 RepID=UPI0001B1D535|nr:S-formylglutathione hydrolase [Thalassobium sp. R2A62]EET49163.1 S-formylglutathione hydrolase [Thalassobium sp. R2A62]MDG1339930.1 S-formylglutathione hydrolase [Paracoccaceae bacterium]
METISENICFGGTQGVYKHASTATNCDMTFAVFLPTEARDGPVPVLWFLSGLTCTHENAMTKAGAQAWAAEQGIALVFPDTSPRGDGVPNDDAYDLGQGAGFYIDATEAPWSEHFKMWSYIATELPALLGENFPLDMDRQSITGHSMGGHGALTLAMSLPGRFRSVSAFAPICNPTASDWGRKQFAAYWGDEANWGPHDATLLMQDGGFDGPMLIDTGTDDQFWDLLGTTALAAAMTDARQNGLLRLQKGYDHSYFFISTFMEDHVSFHAEALWA